MSCAHPSGIPRFIASCNATNCSEPARADCGWASPHAGSESRARARTVSASCATAGSARVSGAGSESAEYNRCTTAGLRADAPPGAASSSSASTARRTDG
jgi:hypothetical protein